MIQETAVTLTDYALAVEGVLLALLLRRRLVPGPLRTGFVCFFLAAAAAALLGGTVHGFVPADSGPLGAALWRATLLSIGAAAAAAWAVGIEIGAPGRQGKLLPPVLAAYGVYAVVVLAVRQDFIVAILGYLPAIAFLMVVFALDLARGRGGAGPGQGLAGLAGSLVAAGIQQAGLGLHPVWLDHNVLYHLVQGASLVLLYRAGCAYQPEVSS